MLVVVVLVSIPILRLLLHVPVRFLVLPLVGRLASPCGRYFLTRLLTTLELPFTAQLGYPLSVDMLEPLQKVWIPATKLTHYRSLLHTRLAGWHGHVADFRSVGAH